MKILTPYRERKFKSIPTFTKDSRSVYLLPNAQTNRVLNGLKSNEAKVAYLVRRAYFRAKGMFFSMDQASKLDIRAAKNLLGIKETLNFSKYTSKLASYHRQLILKESEWIPYEIGEHRKILEDHAVLFVDKMPEREELLFNLLDFCWYRRIEIPSYTEFATIVSNSLNMFNQKVKHIVSNSITSEQRTTLLELINDPELYGRMSQLKVINQSTSPIKLKAAAEDLSLFKKLYFKIEDLAEKVNLTQEAQKHFSKLVKDMTLTDLRKLKDSDDVAVKLLGFTQDQYITRNDAAIASILKVLREWSNKAVSHEKEIKERESAALENATESVAIFAKSAELILKEARAIAYSKQITEGERFTKIKLLLDAYEESQNPNINNYIEAVTKGVLDTKNNARKINFLFKNSISIQRSISPLLKLLVIDKENSETKLSEAIGYFIETDGNIQAKNAPTDFLSNSERALLKNETSTSFREKYKVLLFMNFENAVRGKRMNFLHSYLYQPAHKLQISDKQWSDKYEEYLKSSELWEMRDGKAVLEKIGKKTSESIVRVNQQIQDEQNPYITIHGEDWKLEDYDSEFDTTQYIPSLLKGSKKVLLYKTLAALDEELRFSEEFMLPDQIGGMTTIEKKYIYGVLISLGTNIGHLELARASELSEKTLRDIDMKRFTKEKLDKVNKLIVKRIQSLDLTSIYEDELDVIHSSSDGKKIVVAVDSLLANYSYKYYGKEQGISANSFVDNKQSFFHVNVLSSSEREAAYMIDGLVRARENIYKEIEEDPFIQSLDDDMFYKKSHRHSTDTFGYTDAAFSGLFFINVSFAPRIKNIENTALHAYEHKYIKSECHLPIAPKRAITKSLILDNWDDILRFMATIKLGYAPASTLFRMLSAKGDSKLYKALKEFGKLLKTQFVYAYIEDVELRQRIQKQLNRAELGQRFKDAVFHRRKGQLKVGELKEIEKVVACTNILQNIIVLWNYLFLIRYLMQIESKSERKTELLRFANGSVIAWAHFNMGGTYDFEHLEIDSFGISLEKLFKAKVTY